MQEPAAYVKMLQDFHEEKRGHRICWGCCPDTSPERLLPQAIPSRLLPKSPSLPFLARLPQSSSRALKGFRASGPQTKSSSLSKGWIQSREDVGDLRLLSNPSSPINPPVCGSVGNQDPASSHPVCGSVGNQDPASSHPVCGSVGNQDPASSHPVCGSVGNQDPASSHPVCGSVGNQDPASSHHVISSHLLPPRLTSTTSSCACCIRESSLCGQNTCHTCHNSEMKVLGAILRGLEARLYRRIRLLFIQYLKETGLYEQVWRRGDPAHQFLHIQEARKRKRGRPNNIQVLASSTSRPQFINDLEDYIVRHVSRQLGGARKPTLGEIAEHLPCDGPPCHRALKEYTVPASDCRKALIGQSGVMLDAGWQPSLPPGTLLGSYEGCHMFGEHFDEYSREIPVCYQDTYTPVLLPEYQACPEAAELVKNERVRDPCWWVDVNKYGMDIRRHPFSQNFMRSISFSVSEEEHCIIRDSSDVVVSAFPRSATGSCLLSLINDPAVVYTETQSCHHSASATKQDDSAIGSRLPEASIHPSSAPPILAISGLECDLLNPNCDMAFVLALSVPAGWLRSKRPHFFQDCKAEMIAMSSERNTASQHMRLGEAGCIRVDSEQEDIILGGEVVDGRAGGWVLPFVKTTIEIKGGDDLRFSYGAEYWKSRADNVKWLRHEMKRAHVQVKKEMEREEAWRLRNNLLKQREDELIKKEHALDSIVAQRQQFH